jgi:hypothetical protein
VSIDEGRGLSRRHGSAATGPFSVLASNSRYCHPADGFFDADTLPSHAICLSLFAEVPRKSSEIESAYRLQHHLRSATRLDWVDVTKFKTTKINSEGFL